MHEVPEKVCLVIPCFNEATRLDLGAFARESTKISFVFVNDGSTDHTDDVIAQNLPANAHQVNLRRNVGKAEAVRVGVRYALAQPELADVTWLGFWDADLATPLTEVRALLKYQAIHNKSVDAVIGSRVYRLGANIERSFLRHVLGRLFSTVTSLLLKIKSYDSQCGAKLFRRSVAEKVFEQRFLSKWLFDLEILFRLDGYFVVEAPLSRWADVSGSKVKIFAESLRIIRDLLKIRKAYLQADTGVRGSTQAEVRS